MRYVFTLLLLITLSKCFAQKEMPTNEPLFPLPMNNEGQVIYEGIIDTPSLSKTILYNNARSWLSSAFRSSKSIIDYDDKETGKIVSKVSASTYIKGLGIKHMMGYWNYTFTIIVKDGKYKYIITNFVNEGNTTNNCKSVGPIETADDRVSGLSCPNHGQLRQMKTILAVETSVLIEDLKKGMIKKSDTDF